MIGLISDTHGLLRPEALRALAGVDLIIHAGDIGPGGIIETLSTIAPVVAIKGNNDKASPLPATAIVESGAVKIYILHNILELDLDPAAAGFHVVVSGHTHKPMHNLRNGVHYINPGSAGPRRFKNPITVALLDSNLEVRFIPLL